MTVLFSSTRRSKRSVPSGWGGNTRSRSSRVTPAFPPSTRKAESPWAPSSPGVRAKTTYRSANPEFDIQVLRPLTTKPEPDGVAVAAIEAASDPASGSDSAKAGKDSALE